MGTRATIALMAIVRPASLDPDLPTLPKQSDVPWPVPAWPRRELEAADRAAFDEAVDRSFGLTPDLGYTYAILLVHRGELVFERYDHGAGPFYLQYSWSMAKSITHALVGLIVARDGIDIYAPLALTEWRSDGRREITLDQLLRMASGLAFVEDYVDGEVSDVIKMLNFEADMGAYAANQPLAHTPGSVWSYSSGTTNIICRWLRDRIGGPDAMLTFMRENLFEPIGMRSPLPKFDASGTFVGSSYLLATPQDFARFGLLYLRDGQWDGHQILPPGWVDYARSESARDPSGVYGAHWWLIEERPKWFRAAGYDGQSIVVAPDKDAVLVRCGRSPEQAMAELNPGLWQLLDAL